MTTPAAAPASPASPAPASPQPSPEAADTSTPPDQQQQTQQPEPDPDTAATDAADDTDDDGQDDDEDHQDDEEHQDDGSDKSKASREAAKWRVKAREYRDSLVSTTAALGMQQQAIVDQAIAAAGFPPQFAQLLESGHELDSLLDAGGLVDHDKVREAIITTAREYGVRPNTGPRPTPGQGQHGGVGGTSTTPWGEVFEEFARR